MASRGNNVNAVPKRRGRPPKPKVLGRIPWRRIENANELIRRHDETKTNPPIKSRSQDRNSGSVSASFTEFSRTSSEKHKKQNTSDNSDCKEALSAKPELTKTTLKSYRHRKSVIENQHPPLRLYKLGAQNKGNFILKFSWLIFDMN